MTLDPRAGDPLHVAGEEETPKPSRLSRLVRLLARVAALTKLFGRWGW